METMTYTQVPLEREMSDSGNHTHHLESQEWASSFLAEEQTHQVAADLQNSADGPQYHTVGNESSESCYLIDDATTSNNDPNLTNANATLLHHENSVTPSSFLESPVMILDQASVATGNTTMNSDKESPREDDGSSVPWSDVPPIKKQRLDESGACASTGYSYMATHSTTTNNRNSFYHKESPPKKVHHNEQWQEMFLRLVEYKKEHGHCLVPKRYARDPKLGTWVETQRVQYKRLPRVWDAQLQMEVAEPNKRLTSERLHKLEDLGFCWSAKPTRKTASTSPQPSMTEADTQLSPHLIPPEVNFPTPIAPLPHANSNNSNGVTAATNNNNDSSSKVTLPEARERPTGQSKITIQSDALWEEMYKRLVAFQSLHGHCLVPRKYEQDPKLGAWVEAQRALWNREIGKGKDGSGSGSALAQPSEDLKQMLPERRRRLDELGFVWSLRSKRIDDHWDEMFRQLMAYKEAYGDCLVPSRYEANLKLGKWVETQRYEYTKLQRTKGAKTTEPEDVVENGEAPRPMNARLTAERLNRLESIGFEWKVKNKMKRYYDKQWDAMFQRLLDFKEKYGHANVPKRFPDDLKLGTWVHTQRIQYRKLGPNANGKESPPPSFLEGELASIPADQVQSFRLTDERRKRLEDIGFCWSAREEKSSIESQDGSIPSRHRMTRNSYDDQWDVMFSLLEQYKREHGDCLVPKRYAQNTKLGTWVDTQRVQYKKLQKKIAELQHKKGDKPNPSNISPVPSEDMSTNSETVDDRSPLVGRLTQDRISRLQNLGFVWSLRDDWAKHYEELKQFKHMNGHCNVPARFAENRRLGIWVSAQRQQYKILQQQNKEMAMDPEEGASTATDAKARRSAPLTQERVDLLNAIGFTWTIRSRDSVGESWYQRLQDLKLFKEQHGHCLVPSRYEPNPELGIWVGTQRTQYRLFMRAKETGMNVSTSMNEERIMTLEELGFVWALRGTAPEDMVIDVENPALKQYATI
eukprot:Nitzschia sp. Nitz4//scaffold107_size73032//27795//30897//NITZ4_005759-RA/size73032-augustus-gene-0.100-mRNA-1//-1//CDS//3329532590//1966//frame0